LSKIKKYILYIPVKKVLLVLFGSGSAGIGVTEKVKSGREFPGKGFWLCRT
jgi:hypothetical protein